MQISAVATPNREEAEIQGLTIEKLKKFQESPVFVPHQFLVRIGASQLVSQVNMLWYCQFFRTILILKNYV